MYIPNKCCYFYILTFYLSKNPEQQQQQQKSIYHHLHKNIKQYNSVASNVFDSKAPIIRIKFNIHIQITPTIYFLAF